MARGQAQRLRAGARTGLANCALLRRVAGLSCLLGLLEVFSGWSELSFQAAQRPPWRAAQPFELLFGDDLLTPEGECELFETLEREDPDLVVMEPPCGPWSPLQNLNDPEVVAEKRRQHTGFWRLARCVCCGFRRR